MKHAIESPSTCLVQWTQNWQLSNDFMYRLHSITLFGIANHSITKRMSAVTLSLLRCKLLVDIMTFSRITNPQIVRDTHWTWNIFQLNHEFRKKQPFQWKLFNSAYFEKNIYTNSIKRRDEANLGQLNDGRRKETCSNVLKTNIECCVEHAFSSHIRWSLSNHCSNVCLIIRKHC